MKDKNKVIKIGFDGKNVTISFHMGRMLEAFGIKNLPTIAYVHKISPRKAKIYASLLLKATEMAESVKKETTERSLEQH